MISKMERKEFSQYIHLFNQRTSIRGIPKLANSTYAAIKWFWGSFVILAHIVMITLVVLLVLRYFQYDRVLKTTSRKVKVGDFPEVTICSKLFFNMGKEIPDPFYVLDHYMKEINDSIADAIDNGDSTGVFLKLHYYYLTSSFFHKRFEYIRTRTTMLADLLTDKCKLLVMDDNVLNVKGFQCEVRGIYNPLYLNCLAFRIPRNISSEWSSNTKMAIQLRFLRKPNDRFFDRFKMDETHSFPIEGSAYQPVRVYMNKESDYPFDYKFDRPIKCDRHNEYILEKTERIISDKQSYQTTTTGSNCKNEDTQANSFGIEFTATREDLCRYLTIQEHLINKCHCFMSSLPKDNASDSTAVPCFENNNLMMCTRNVLPLIETLADSSCQHLCYQTDYAVLHKHKPIYNSEKEKIIKILPDIRNCQGQMTPQCKKLMVCLLKGMNENISNLRCQDVFIEQQNTKIKKENDPYDCSTVHITVEMRPIVSEIIESLVVETNTLLSQISGICAFFTGLTFTFIAEVIETLIIWRIGSPDTV